MRIHPARLTSPGAQVPALTEDTDLLLARLSHAGGARWARTYDGPDPLDDGEESVATLGGDICVAGFTTSPATARDILTLKYGGGGQFRWARSHGGVDMSNDFAAGLLAVSGGVYTAGKRGAGTGNDGMTLPTGGAIQPLLPAVMRLLPWNEHRFGNQRPARQSHPGGTS
ncbi:MAG TPA: hypothetical protein VFZ86_00140 [Thermoleophilia bacterium]|nr:hypothetical protein [Thermoleophilia bacterium]